MALVVGESSKDITKSNVQEVARATVPFSQLAKDRWAPIISAIGDAQVVMIGEATHGTEEFYRTRAEITKTLIEEHGFDFVAVEADWPDAARANRWFCHGRTTDETVDDALGDFRRRFPTWMWRNHVVEEFGEWLRQHNRGKEAKDHVGFHGLDLYALFASATEVIDYLDNVDKKAAEYTRHRYATLGQFKEEPQEYALALRMGLVDSQKENVTKALMALMQKRNEYIKSQGFLDEYFTTEQNAKLVKDAEEYYRKSFSGGVTTWNIRDKHMTDTLQDLLAYYALKRKGATSMPPLNKLPGSSEQEQKPTQQEEKDIKKIRCVIWAHNSHLGDASATEHAQQREWNIGQLTRERLGLGNTFNIGFTTYTGYVSAATSWGGRRQTMSVNPGLDGSYEDFMHRVHMERKHSGKNDEKENGFGIVLRSNDKNRASPDSKAIEILREARLERAIGVQYVKRTERWSHYIMSCLPKQFDYLIHLDVTNALTPLDGDEQP